MKKQLAFLLAAFALLLPLAACGGAEEPQDTARRPAAPITRPEPPDPYLGKTSPLAAPELEEAKKLFNRECASCHGEDGKGDTPTGKALMPPAGNLAEGRLHDAIQDDYIFWRISEGGGFPPFNSGMTPFKASLSEEQRWQLVHYVRTLRK
jgi:mono/diheme cytochrome c family protein